MQEGGRAGTAGDRAGSSPEQGPIAEHITAMLCWRRLRRLPLSRKSARRCANFSLSADPASKRPAPRHPRNNDLAAAAMDNKGSYMAAEAAYDTTTAQVPEDTLKAESDLRRPKRILT